MTQRTLEIVVTCDEGYLGPLRTMLLSLRANNRAGSIRVWILHRGIPQLALESLAVFCGHIAVSYTHLHRRGSRSNELGGRRWHARCPNAGYGSWATGWTG